MKIPSRVHSLQSALKSIALAVPLGTAVLLGLTPTAHGQLPVTSGLVVWLSADSINTADSNQVRVVGADTFVKQWNDGSGGAHHAIQTTEADQPKYIANGLNGKPVLRFSQVNDDDGSEMKLGDLSAFFPTSASMFAVSTIDTDGRYNLFDNRANDSRWVANTWNESVPGVFASNRKNMTYASWPQSGSHTFAMESSSSIYRFVIDGTQIGSTTGDYHNGNGQNWTIGDRPNNGQQLKGDIPEFILYNRVLTASEANLVGGYLKAKYSLTNAYPALPIPPTPTGVTAAPVSTGAVRVSWSPASGAASYNVSIRNTLTNVEQVLSAPASPFNVTGLTNGTTYEFKVLATNSSGASNYSDAVSATPTVSSAKDMLTFVFPGQPEVVISGTNISVTVPVATDTMALAPTYTISPLAIGNPVSGAPRDFTSAQTYTVTAEDGITQVYTVTVIKGAVPTVFTWNTAGAGNWSDSSKWTNDLANGARPMASGIAYYTLNFSQAGTYTSTHDRNAGFLLNKLNFGGTVTLAGSSLTLSANGDTLPTVNQNSVSQVTFNTPISLAANTTIGGTSTGDVTVNSNITGAGSLTKSNGGTLNLNGTNSYTGSTLISAGVVSCSLLNSSPLGGAGSVNVTIQGGAILAMNRNQITGNLTLNGGKIATGNGWGDDGWNGPVGLSGISTIDVGGTDGSFFMTGVVSGSGSLIKLGTSGKAVRLTGANTFTGALNIQAGGIQASSLNRISGGTASSNLGAPTTVANGTLSLGASGTGGTLVYDGPGETTDRVIKLAGTTGSATISQSGTGAGFPTTRGESGFLKLTSNVSIPGTAGVDNRKTLILTHSNSDATGTNPGRGEISGNIGDSVLGAVNQLATSITKSGIGTWTLSGVNSYSGATRIQAGTLILTRALALGSGSLDISNGAKMQLDYIGTRQISALTFNAGAAQANGSYGSSSSLAMFKDDTRFSGPGTVTIGAITGATTTTLVQTSGSEPSNGGDSLAFTATVTGASPTGNVQFFDGLTLVATSTLNGSSQASFTTSNLSAGVHVLTAQYLGNLSNASSSVSLTQTVVETRTIATTTILSSSVTTSAFGAGVTFTATVAGGTPTGSVLFYNGTTELGTATLNGGGQATLSTSGLPVGWNPITARYLGSTTHLPSLTVKALLQTVDPSPGNGKLKVFILAGQSNMVGKGQTEIGRDPNNLALTNLVGGLGSLRNMLNKNPDKYGYMADPGNLTPQGNPGWLKRSDCWVTYTGEPAAPGRTGMLDANFGNTGGLGLIGPEYGFGLVVASQFADPVLLIKIAWGGKSLAVDFRPPGAVAARGGAVGPFYTSMVARVDQVLADLPTYYPGYNVNGGYEISGFGWHQGFNDRINATYTAEYEANMTNLIKDLRTRFNVQNLPVVIGETGMGNAPTGPGSLVEAQRNVADPVKHPEFAGNVSTVKTTQFDYGILLGTSTEGYHWNWSGESYFNIGESMGKAMMSLIPAQSTGFSAWTSNSAQGLTAGVNDSPSADPDVDGISNLMEFALGGAPMVSSRTILPKLEKPAGNWLFEYDRSDLSLSPATTQVVEYGSDLIGWTQVIIPATSANSVTITLGSPSDRVTVTIPNLGNQLFVRLKVSQ